MKVRTSKYFYQLFLTLSDDHQQKVFEFVAYVENYGLKGLAGRNKFSAPKNTHTKKQRANFDYAQKHCLWHYHIGIPYYVGEFGDMTSEYILHYQRFDSEIILVDIGIHPPFILPTLEKLI
ncbi:MAG: hypothetical protein Q4B79_08785 [Moraxella sp.]|uniref:hypothetical protein n=1 Tax=Moraxella sp. TaxID=479 RepID=UPI0026DC3569|nr:hypothetical protein [Moraxella sp.]MDO4451034.1 hypothetical protein [Moraxella sp.]